MLRLACRPSLRREYRRERRRRPPIRSFATHHADTEALNGSPGPEVTLINPTVTPTLSAAPGQGAAEYPGGDAGDGARWSGLWAPTRVSCTTWLAWPLRISTCWSWCGRTSVNTYAKFVLPSAMPYTNVNIPADGLDLLSATLRLTDSQSTVHELHECIGQAPGNAELTTVSSTLFLSTVSRRSPNKVKLNTCLCNVCGGAARTDAARYYRTSRWAFEHEFFLGRDAWTRALVQRWKASGEPLLCGLGVCRGYESRQTSLGCRAVSQHELS